MSTILSSTSMSTTLSDPTAWNGDYRTDTTTTTTTKKTSALVSDIITSSSVVPSSLRARTIVISANAMKPFASVNLFLDEVNLDTVFTPCVMLELPVGSKFIGQESNIQTDNISLRTTQNINQKPYLTLGQGLSTLPYWTYFTNAHIALGTSHASRNCAYDIINRGEVITCSTGSAVVVADEMIYDRVTKQTKRIVYVTNVIGSLSGQIIGKLSSSTATITTTTIKNSGACEVNSNGNVYGTLTIPPFTFTAGNHNILISDSTDPNNLAGTTISESSYDSTGTLVFTVESVLIQNSTDITSTSTSSFTYVWPSVDPLAQTFTLPDSMQEGCAITSVELFVAYKDPAETQPIIVQIVETLNGYPTKTVVPNAQTYLMPANIVADNKGNTSTKFTFSNLIWLTAGTEYAIKVLSNSVTYKVWTSYLGDKAVNNPGLLVSTQPILGSLFKSQNNSTWTAEQLQDLTFRLNRAKFNTRVLGHPTLVEAPNASFEILPPNPFKVTNGQLNVKVSHPNHGLSVGMLVQYNDSTDTPFNSVFTVNKVVNSDSYIIALPAASSPTVSNFTGGNVVKVEQNVKYDTLRVFGTITGPNVGLRLSARLATDTAIDSADVILNTNYLINDYTSNKWVHSSLNRIQRLAGASSFTLKGELSSVDDAMSPVINLDKLSVQLISNKINTPALTDIDYTIDFDPIVTGSSNVTFVSGSNVITVPSTTDFSRIVIGAQSKIMSGNNINKTGYISAYDVAGHTITIVPNTTADVFVYELLGSASINQYSSYVTELFNAGTAESKHITKQVNLLKASTGFRIITQMNIHTSADIAMYYRTGLSSSSSPLSKSGWVNYPISYIKSANEFDFTEYEYSILNIPHFDQFQFKFVFLSTTNAVTPKLKTMRIIAHS
jgi:hypothetical protein